jgi:hypothetical protein
VIDLVVAADFFATDLYDPGNDNTVTVRAALAR